MNNSDSTPTEPMIVVDHVDMVFNIANEQLNSLKEYFIKAVKRELFFREFKALQDISITVNRGDVYGIVGTNGSGKSTLLKIIAGVLEPTRGSCTVNGTIAPLIELGAGFDPELTARENVYLNGALLGYRKEFIDENFQSIIDFAEVGPFVDMPLKNYSSGMIARIAFAIATATTPDILVVDEALSVGDVFFQEKCECRINSLIKSGGTTVLFVSHSIDQVERICDRAIWIDRGHKVMEGEVSDVCAAYRNLQYVDYAVSNGVMSAEYLSFDHLNAKLTCAEMIGTLETCTNSSDFLRLKDHLTSLLAEDADPSILASRELVGEMLYRLALTKRPLQKNASGGSLKIFKDEAAIDPRLTEGLSWCVERQLLVGTMKSDDSKSILPKDPISRIDFAKLITKLFRGVLLYPEDVSPTHSFAKEGYYDYVLSNSLMEGYASGQFGLDDEATRGQVVTVIWRSLGEPDAEGLYPYQDVGPSTHYATPVAWAFENDMLPVFQGGAFHPDKPLSRKDLEPIVESLVKYAKLGEKATEDIRNIIQGQEGNISRATLAKLSTVFHRSLCQ